MKKVLSKECHAPAFVCVLCLGLASSLVLAMIKKRGPDLSFCEDTEIWNLRSVDVAHSAGFEIKFGFTYIF